MLHCSDLHCAAITVDGWKQVRMAVLATGLFASAAVCVAAQTVRIDAITSQQLDAQSTQQQCSVDIVEDCWALLPAAFEMVQDARWQERLRDGGATSVQIRLGGGHYRVFNALALHWGRGATQAIKLEIIGAGSTSIVSGAMPISVWDRASDKPLPKRLRKSAAEYVWIADVSTLQLPFNQIPQARGYGLPPRPVSAELFIAGNPQAVAGWPNAGFGELARPNDVSNGDRVTFSIAGRSVNDWHDEPDLLVQGFWHWDWASQTYLVGQKDPVRNRLFLLGEGSPYGIRGGQRVRIENALAELDAPGEWYLDRAAKSIYLYSVSSPTKQNVEVSVAQGLLHISDARNVSIRNLRFEQSRGDAVVVRSSDNIVFDGVSIANTGNRGLVIEKSRHSGIRNSVIENNGEGAVFLSGGDRQTLTGAANFVEQCIVRNFSRLKKTMGFAVELEGVGQRVTGNTISLGPHTAVFFSGNDHTIADNEIFDVVKETSDAGAIYVGRDFTAHGTVIENNFLHDIQPYAKHAEVKGVYVDDQASGITIRNNIFAYVQQPVFIGGGRDNIVEHNLFYFSQPALTLDARGVEGQAAAVRDPAGMWQKRLDAVPYRSSIYARRFPNLARIREDDFGMPKYNLFRENTIVGGVGPKVSERAAAGIGLSKNETKGEEIFAVNKPTSGRHKRENFVLKSPLSRN